MDVARNRVLTTDHPVSLNPFRRFINGRLISIRQPLRREIRTRPTPCDSPLRRFEPRPIMPLLQSHQQQHEQLCKRVLNVKDRRCRVGRQGFGTLERLLGAVDDRVGGVEREEVIEGGGGCLLILILMSALIRWVCGLTPKSLSRRSM
jgi:hypothetical protein